MKLRPFQTQLGMLLRALLPLGIVMPWPLVHLGIVQEDFLTFIEGRLDLRIGFRGMLLYKNKYWLEEPHKSGLIKERGSGGKIHLYIKPVFWENFQNSQMMLLYL